MVAAFDSAKSYRVSFKVEDGSEVAIEVVKPDRIHTKITFPGGKAELIRIAKDGWVLTPVGPWTKISGSDDPMGGLPSPDGLLNSFKDSEAKGEKLTKGGVITVNGVQCEQWIAQVAAPVGSVIMCIGVKDSLPVQAKSGDGTFNQQFSDWNVAFKIEPPI